MSLEIQALMVHCFNIMVLMWALVVLDKYPHGGICPIQQCENLSCIHCSCMKTVFLHSRMEDMLFHFCLSVICLERIYLCLNHSHNDTDRFSLLFHASIAHIFISLTLVLLL